MLFGQEWIQYLQYMRFDDTLDFIDHIFKGGPDLRDPD